MKTERARACQLTLHVLDTLSLFAGLANDLDGPARKCAELQVSCHHELDEDLDFLALFVRIVDIQLFRYALSSDNGKSGRIVLSRCPVQYTLLTASFATD